MSYSSVNHHHSIHGKLSRWCGYFYSRKREKRLLLSHTRQSHFGLQVPLIFYDWNHIKRQLAKKSRLIVLVIILSLCIIFTRDNAQQLAKFSSIYNEKVKISPIYNERIQQQHDKVIQQMSF